MANKENATDPVMEISRTISELMEGLFGGVDEAEGGILRTRISHLGVTDVDAILEVALENGIEEDAPYGVLHFHTTFAEDVPDEALADGTDGLGDPQTMTRMADELLDGVLGGGGEAVSFVSPRNTRVEMVQFVFMTQGIHAPAAARTEPAAEDTGNVISRLVDLFR